MSKCGLNIRCWIKERERDLTNGPDPTTTTTSTTSTTSTVTTTTTVNTTTTVPSTTTTTSFYMGNVTDFLPPPNITDAGDFNITESFSSRNNGTTLLAYDNVANDAWIQIDWAQLWLEHKDVVIPHLQG